MHSVIRGLITYLFIFIIFRLSGKRTLKESTPFDLVLLLVFSEATQEALIDDDKSITNSFIVIITLILIDITFSYLKIWSTKADEVIEGTPMILVENGKKVEKMMKMARVDEDDILESGRSSHAIQNMDDIRYAILENNGSITVIPKVKSQ